MRNDIQYAWRTALRSPGFVVAATCTLALGIGANTAIFSIISSVLLRPLPFAHPERLVQVYRVDPRFGPGAVPYPDVQDWRAHGSIVEEISGYGNTSINLLDSGEPERLQAVSADRRLFRTLGVAPALGRTFRDDDPLNVVVLSSGLWKRRFRSDPACIGRGITLERNVYTVIGVMPEDFQFPYRASPAELWIPWQPPAAYPRIRVENVAARLKPGVTLPAARQEAAARGFAITPLAEVVTGKARPALLTLLGAVGLVLLIACANVANLLLARAARRTREMAVRAALGATRGRLLRQLLTESVLLSMVGGLGGLMVAAASLRLILKLAAAAIPRANEIGLDWRVFLFLFAASAGAGILFGLLPALAAARADVQSALKQADGGRSVGTSQGGRWLRDGLVVAEIGLSFVLLVSAGLVLRTFLRLQSTPAGFMPENVLTMHLTIALADYSVPGTYGRYAQQLEDRIRRIPGVRAAGLISYLPLQNWGWNATFNIKGQTPQANPPQTELRYVSPGYFEALHIPLRRGRVFTDHDTPATPLVIVVNETLARRYFPNQDAVGRETDRGIIAGIIGDVRTSRLDLPATPEIYYCFAQNTAATTDAGVSVVVSTQSRPELMTNAIRDAIHEVNPRQAIFRVRTMEQVVAESLADMNLYLWLIGVFAALAVVLATSGVYGVISYVVAVRTQEFGVRLALGAGGAQILRLVLGHGAGLVACGVIAGAAGTLGAVRLLTSLLHGAATLDPLTLSGVAALLASVGLAACLAPARRAMRVDPVIALKYE